MTESSREAAERQISKDTFFFTKTFSFMSDDYHDVFVKNVYIGSHVSPVLKSDNKILTV